MANKNIPTAAQSMASVVQEMHNIARDARPQQTMIGKVLAPPPAIKVEINSIVLEAKDCYISEYWLIGHERTAKGHIVSATQNRSGGSGDAAYASHNHDIDNDYTDTIIYTDTLKPGDLVSVVPIYNADPVKSEQLYWIGQKVVKL